MPSYQIPIERVATLEQWCSWLLELHARSWMAKRDLFLFTALWFTNRRIDYSDLAAAARPSPHQLTASGDSAG